MSASKASEIFDAVRQEGESELKRPIKSLFWSGIAAGVMMGTSVVGKAVFMLHLPEAKWKPLVAGLGYTFGFLIVVMGHMQLFTENTITTILPILQHKNRHTLWCTARLWSVVFFANMIGAFAMAWLLSSGVVDAALYEQMLHVSREGVEHGFKASLLLGIPAGFLIAAMVWMIRLANDTASFWVIIAITWLIAAGHFTHVIAGSVEVFLLFWAHGASKLGLVIDFIAPTFLGNVAGGTLLFSLLAYAQVKDELA